MPKVIRDYALKTWTALLPGGPLFLPLNLLALALAGAASLTPLYLVQDFSHYLPAADVGRSLFYGINDTLVTRGMPLFTLLLALPGDLPAALPRLTGLLLLLTHLLAYALGRAMDGPRGGALYLLAAALVTLTAAPEPEQVFFTLGMLLYLNAERAREAAPSGRAFLAAGLALGITLLVRPALAFFAPLAVLVHNAGQKAPLRRAARNAALFLLGAYVLLLPWARLNHFLLGSASFFEYERSIENVVTGAKGTIFTMDADETALAGLERGDSVYGWALSVILADPGAYAGAVARRVWHLLKLHPALFLLGLLPPLLLRRTHKLLAALAVYYVLVHCLMSIEPRYFHPLRYLLAFLALSWAAGPAPKTSPWRPARLFLPAGLAVALAAEIIVLAYPWRAVRPRGEAVAALAAALPGNPWLQQRHAELLLLAGRTEEGLEFLARACGASPRAYAAACYVSQTRKSPDPLPPPKGAGPEDILRAVKMFREAELGLSGRAAAEFNRVYTAWRRARNVLRGVPYARDAQVLAELNAYNNTLYEITLPGALLYWPPGDRARLMDAFRRLAAARLKGPTAAFLALPLAGPGDLAAFRRYVYDTPLTAYADPLFYRELGEKFTAALRLEAGRRERPREAEALTAAALRAKREAGPGFTSGELKLLAEFFSGAAGAAGRLAVLRPESPEYFLLAAGDAADPAGLFPGAYASAAAAYFSAGEERKGRLVLAALLGSRAAGGEQLRLASGELLAAGREKEALQLLDAAVARGGGAAAYNERGLLLRRAGSPGRAAEDFAKALSLEPGFLEAELNLAAALLAGGGAPAAGQDALLRRGIDGAALRRLRGRESLALRAASYFAGAGQGEKALQLAAFALERPDLDGQELASAALTLQSLGRLGEALAALDRALALAPGNPGLRSDRGVALRLLGREGEAEKEFRAAVRLDPGLAPAWLNLADLLAAAGKPEEAAGCYRKVLALPEAPAPMKEAASAGLGRTARG